MHPFWQSCSDDFKQELSPHQFATWIKPLRFEQDGDSFTLIAPNRHVMQWVKDRLLGRIEQAGEKYFARAIHLELALDEAPIEQNEFTPEPLTAAIVTTPPARGTEHRVNPSFTFTSFIGGKANQLARAAAIQVGQNPGQAYNPLFVYGATGLGKTHLVQAIGNQLLSHKPDANIRYIHAEQFVTDVVRAYQH